MRTRRSPKNQDRLFKALFQQQLGPTIKEAQECRTTLANLHQGLYPECDGGCPSEEYLTALDAAVRQAQAKRPRWNADLGGDLERAIQDAKVEIGQYPAR